MNIKSVINEEIDRIRFVEFDFGGMMAIFASRGNYM